MRNLRNTNGTQSSKPAPGVQGPQSANRAQDPETAAGAQGHKAAAGAQCCASHRAILPGIKLHKPPIAFILCLALVFSLIPIFPAGQVFAEPTPGPEAIDISFTFNSTEPAIYSFNPDRGKHVISCPAITAGSIEFPAAIGDDTLTLSGISIDVMGTAVSGINEGTIAITGGNTLTFTQPFKRITLVAELAGESEPYYFTFYQPGYSELTIAFAFKNVNKSEDSALSTTTRAIDHSLPSDESDPVPPIEISLNDLNLAAARIEVGGALSGSGEAIGDIGGGILEYLVDRSSQVESIDGDIIVNKGFGKVVIHYFYIIGNSLETSFITFYEPDFAGIDVQPDVNAGDYGQTGVVNVSSGVEEASSFVYFKSNSVEIKPYDDGLACTITAVTSIAAEDIASNSGVWTVTPPAATEPVTELTLTLDVEGEENPRDVTLQIKRVLIMSASYDFRDKPGDYLENPETIYHTPITTAPGTTHVNGYGNFQTFLTVFGYDGSDGGGSFSIDHTLLVLYYKDDRVLGSREYPVQCLTGDREKEDRHEVLVFRESDPAYADVASANRVTAFVIDKEGALNESFGGATFGVGTGWGHLMPNHSGYGSGKDGMEQ